MDTGRGRQFTLKELQTDPAHKRFTENTPSALAGRCLLDAIEYLRSDLKWPSQFEQLKLGHAIRLVTTCLKAFPRHSITKRSRFLIEPAYKSLLESRKNDPPFFGDDFWDWASIVEALQVAAAAYPGLPNGKTTPRAELRSLLKEVKSRLATGLALGKTGEWFGPATAAVVYRVLRQYQNDKTVKNVLKELKRQALLPIQGGRYMARAVSPGYHVWHYGQVLSVFGRRLTSLQQGQIRNLKRLQGLGPAELVYALARVIEGAQAVRDQKTRSEALDRLYKCQQLDRPLGTGLLGDNVKGSLNVLDALWPVLQRDERAEIELMLNQLWAVYKSANTVGIVVALDREREACENGFTTAGALVEEPDEKGSVQINHENYRAVIVVGKGLLDVQEATKTLLNHHRPRWVMMVGIAGSLGRKAARGFQGPKKGDVVVSTSTAVWEIRVKIREEGRSVSVPWDGGEWDILPADPTMFRVAHAVRTELKEIPVHEGLIVTANGIRDQPAEKARILEKWPGGLAVEEEGFVVAFESARRGVPHIVVRGISDLAGGDKIAQQERGNEKKDQEQAAKAAARFAVLVTEALSWRW